MMPWEPQEYYVVLDEAPIKGSPTPLYVLMQGSLEDAIGLSRGSATTIRELVRQVPEDRDVYRVFLQRTDGKTGHELIRPGKKLVGVGVGG